jgi:hypothetical protein
MIFTAVHTDTNKLLAQLRAFNILFRLKSLFIHGTTSPLLKYVSKTQTETILIDHKLNGLGSLLK